MKKKAEGEVRIITNKECETLAEKYSDGRKVNVDTNICS